jgi:hypothetical protein
MTINPADQRIDAFVAAVNKSGRESMPFEDVPVPCQRTEIDFHGCPTGWCDWQIVPSTGAEWLGAVESKLPFRLPPTFRSLISRYVFPPFDAGPIQFFSVGAEETGTEFRFAFLADPCMSPFLLQHGYMQFGRPKTGDYDPICFDFTVRKKAEPPVVRIDHEEILCNERLRVIETISPAFSRIHRGNNKEIAG